MSKAPNEGKITTFLRQCLTAPSAKADLSVLYSPSDLSVEQVEYEDMHTYHIYARCNLPYGVCPYCGIVSHRIHSRYRRTITDLSILGHPVVITFEARKFFCCNSDCRRKTFAEQAGDEVFRYRRTQKVDSRQVMFNEVKELQTEGFNIAQISKKLDIARQTVRKYMDWNTLSKRAGKERLPYFLYDAYVEEAYRHGKDLRKIFLEIKKEGFPGTLTPFYDHYGYLSDGHHGYRSQHEVEKEEKAPRYDREPLLPIRHIAHIVDKSIRKKKMIQTEVALIEKMISYDWFREI